MIRLVSVTSLLIVFCFLPRFSGGQDARKWTEANLDDLVGLYRHLHANPELSFQEEKTSRRLAEEWRKAGLTVTERVGGFGIVGILRNSEGPTLMLRTDLDALPVPEQTNLAFASKVTAKDDKGKIVPVMHACGHDVHMTNLTGVIQFLAKNRSQWSGTLMVIGQPAEERGAGAKAMLEDGLFKKFPRPDFALALHVDSYLATGKVSVRKGYALANVDSVDVTMKGKGGHGAAPHTTVDPIVQAAEFVVALQQIVAREIKPIEPAVITVGSIHGGTKHNIIGNECHLQLTVRSYSDEVREHLIEGIKRKAKSIAAGARAPDPEIKVSEGTPSLFNNEELADRLIPVFQKVVGKKNLVFAEPVMGGEDFSRYGRAGIPILMYRLGVVDGKKLERFKKLGQPAPSLHSPLFFPDIEDSLMVGIPTMAEAAIHLLQKKSK